MAAGECTEEKVEETKGIIIVSGFKTKKVPPTDVARMYKENMGSGSTAVSPLWWPDENHQLYL